ncbi:AI-2E family transporter [Agathobaculum sp.]|uniref:AI-2E family transporter n=1 Tax=Agathobaculum sp. TaxID=2048138 RepID=UPI002A7EDD49|nr:AI-2E family transporter [Agathobaculum sp.]MDY3618048.1 AI-2E family transporter [Agathobaculum sp.]
MNLNRDNMKKAMGLILFTVLLFVGLQNTKLVGEALRYVLGLLAPFLIGGCLAFILNVPMRFFEKNLFTGTKATKNKKLLKMKRVCSIILTLIVVFGVVVIVLFMVLPELYNSITAIGTELAAARARVPEWLDQISTAVPAFEKEILSLKESWLEIDWKEVGAMVVQFLQNGSFLSDTFNFATSVLNGVTNALIGLVFAIYILMQKETLGRQFRRLFYSFFPERRVDRFLEICGLTSSSFNSFLSGQCLEAFILGMMFFVAMSIFKIPYALMIAVVIGVTALIPIFGAFIGCVVGAMLIFILSPMKALWFLVLFLVLQQVEGNFIYPRVVGSSVGLPSIWVLSAVTLGASVAGIIGMLFAIPVFSVLYTLLRETVRARVKERAIDADKIK